MSPWRARVRSRAVATVCALAAAPLPCGARPLTLDDLQQLEGVARAEAAPDGVRLIVETIAPYREARTFDEDRLIVLARSRLSVLDTSAPRPRLAPLARGRGCAPLGFSPTGRMLAIGCLFRRHLRLGLADLRRAKVRWTGEDVLAPRNGPSLRWRDEGRLVLLEPAGDPQRLTFPNGAAGEAALHRLRRRQARGAASGPLVFGAGAYARPAPPTTRVVEADLRTGARRVLARGAFDDLELAPSGRVAALTGPGAPPRLAPVPAVGVSDTLATRRLTLLELDTGRTRAPAPTFDLAPTLLAWSSRDRLLVFARREGAGAWSKGGYLIVDPQNAAPEPVRLDDLQPGVASYGTEAFPVARGGWSGDTPEVWATASNNTSGWYAVGPGSPPQAAAGPPAPTASQSLGRGLRGLFAPGAEPERLAARYGLGRRVLARAGAAELDEVRDAHGVASIRLVRDDRSWLLARLNAHLAEVDAVRPLRLARRADTGRVVSDWLYLPPGSPRPPLVVLPYPGSAYDTEPLAHQLGTPPPPVDAQLLAAHGYAVLVPSLPRERGDEPAARTLSDVLAAVDGAVATGRVDPDRLALWGHSFGGYAVLQLITETDRFRAAIAAAAVSDLVSVYGAFSPEGRAPPFDTSREHVGFGWSETGQGGLGVPPWIRPDLYVRNSPIFGAARVRTPVLLISGDQDFVGPSQAEEMFSALRRQDKDVQLLVLPGEGHVPASPINQDRVYAAAFRFLDEAFARRLTATPAASPRSTQASGDLPLARR